MQSELSWRRARASVCSAGAGSVGREGRLTIPCWSLEDEGHIIALCHVYARPALDKPPEAVVQALVRTEFTGAGELVGR